MQQTIPLQTRAMREYAARRGWTITLQVKEIGSGASQRERREALLEAARRREIDSQGQAREFDRAGLLGLVRDVYAAYQDNQTFLHARLGLGEDVLKPYKQTIDRWLWPDSLPTSVAISTDA
jgi:hypothetical protein